MFLVHATMRDCYATLPDANKMNTWWLQYFLWSWRPFISFDGRWGKDTEDTHHRDLGQDHPHRWARVKETHNHDLRIENTKIKPNVAIRWYFTSLIIIVGPSCDTITGITLTFPPQPKWVHSGIIRGGHLCGALWHSAVVLTDDTSLVRVCWPKLPLELGMEH